MSTPRRIAAIDLGTNTTLMLVAEVGAASALKVLEDRATITRLGRGVDRTGRLTPEAMERTLATLREYAVSAARWGAPIVAVGTSALRDAQNRDAFLAPAEEILGCAIEAIAGEREAELTFGGALEGIETGPAPITVVDVGGGSTEIIVGAGASILARASLDFGSVRMHERHQLTAPTTDAQVEAVRAEVRSMLAASRLVPAPRMLAIAGTATTLAAMVGEVDPYDPTRVHGMYVTRQALKGQLNRLHRASAVERARMVGVHPDRADVLGAGVTILDELLDWTGAEGLLVSDGGVRFGLARHALSQFGDD